MAPKPRGVAPRGNPKRSSRIAARIRDHGTQPVYPASTSGPPRRRREHGAYDRFHSMGINGLRDAAQTRNINLTRYRPLSELTNRRRLRQMLRGHDRYGPMSPDEITAEMERRGHSVAPVGNLEDPENPDNQEIRENRGRLQEVLVQLDNGAEANLSRPVRNMLARRRAIFKEISKDQKKLPATRVSRSPPASRPTTRSSSRSTRLTPPPIDTSVDKMPNNAPSQPASDGPSPPPQGDGDGNEPAGGHDTEDDPGSDHASETSGDGPDTAHDEAIARALQDKSQTPEAAKTEEEKERKRKQDEEDERRRKATRSRNRKRAKQLRQEHRFDAAAGLPGPLRQLEVTGDGHCLYRAFGVAYYGSENIARGVRDEHSEDQYCLYVRGRLRRWWNKVTRERTSEESRSRLEYYRALNAMSAREGTQTRDRMQTYIHALETNSEAILGYSPTLEEDTDRGVETLAWQINSLDDDNVGGTFETVQVLADAFDVEIIIHVPRLNGGHPPEIEDWETFARGRQGAQQIHLIQWMDGLHWTAAMPAEEGIDWASVIAEDARLPIAHSGFPLIETTVPPELPVAIRYTGLDSAADRPSAPSSGSANSIAGRRGSSRKRPSPEVGSSEVRQLKQPKTTQPRIHDTAPPLRDARADHQVQPPKTSSEGPRGNRDNPNNGPSVAPLTEGEIDQRMWALLEEARQEIETREQARQEAENPMQSIEDPDDYQDPAAERDRTSRDPNSPRGPSQAQNSTSNLTHPTRPTQQQQPSIQITRPTTSPISPSTSPPATTPRGFNFLVHTLGLERALEITRGEPFIEDPLIEVPEPEQTPEPEYDPFVSGIRPGPPYYSEPIKRWRDKSRIRRNQEPEGANPASNGLLPEDAISDTSEDDTLALIPVRDFFTREVLVEGRPGRIPGSPADKDHHPLRRGERGINARTNFGPFLGNRTHAQYSVEVEQRAAARRRLRHQQKVRGYRAVDAEEDVEEGEAGADEETDQEDEGGHLEGTEGNDADQIDRGSSKETIEISVFPNRTIPRVPNGAAPSGRPSESPELVERPDTEAAASAPNGAALNDANGDEEVNEEFDWEEYLNESGGQDDENSQIGTLRAALALQAAAPAPAQGPAAEEDVGIESQRLR